MSATKYEVNTSFDQNNLINLPAIKIEKLPCEMLADVGQELVVSLPRIKIEDLGPYINEETDRRNLESSSWSSQGGNQETKSLQCSICVYSAQCKCDLTRHMFWHKDPLNPKMLRCPFCQYRNSEHTNDFQLHLLSHRTLYSKWKCSICHYLSISVQDLRNHLFVHKDPSDVNLFQCPFCQYKTKELTNLNSHMRIHETMLSCCVCEGEYLNKNDLTKHIVKHRDPNDSCRYKCDFCDHKSKYLSSFRLHYVTHKDLIDALTCCICNYRCKMKEGLEGHMSLHKDTEDIDVFKCYLCNHNTQHLEDLKIHLLTHTMSTDDQKTLYPCICSNKCANKYANHHANNQSKTSHCDAKYSSKFSLKLHMQDYVDPIEKCNICDAEINKSDLKKHKEIFHSRNINDFNQIFECSLCDYRCETQSDLAKHLLIHKDSACSLCPFKTEKELFWISHMLLHSNKKKEWYHCSQCPYRTVVLKHLKGHEDTHKDRSERNLFECSHCHSKYTNKFSLKLHMQDHLDPSEKVIYQCDHCDYKTKLKSILKKHKLKHRLVKCDVCDLEMNEFDRKRHNEIFHSESESDSKKSHNCCICHCKYETKSDLAKHLLAHKDLGNRCTLCKYKTRTKDELSWISHMLLHSNEDEAMKYQCDLCTFRTAKLSRLKHHKEIHKNRSERNLFRCEQCGAEYAAKKSFKAHMAAHGEGLEMVTHYCDQCDFKTLIKSSMRRHKQGHRIQKCGFCNLETHENDLKIHEIFHSESAEDTIEAFKCCICNCTSKTKGSFAEHLLRHKNPNNICDLCGYKSNKEVSWVSHMFVHSNVNIIKFDRNTKDRLQDQSGRCGFCNLKIENQLELKKHVENFHPEKLKAFGVCCLCDSRFESKEDLAKHFFLHKEPTNCGLFKCDKCNYKTKYLNCLKLHRKYANCNLGIDRSKNIVNQIEVKGIWSDEEFKVDLQQHKQLKVEESHCSEPEIPNTMKRSSLNDHIRSEHPSNLKCCICDHKFITKLDLSRHMLLHKDSKSFKCDSCSHRTRYLHHFKLHLRKHKPAGDKKHRCDVCPFEAPYISRMLLHKEVHKDPSERKCFRCLLCDNRYMTKPALKLHMLQHENPRAVKMFYCDTCDFKTMYKVSLKDHKLHRHSKMEKFKCDFCGKKMKRKAALVRHIRTFHSGM